jgi:hypothetical protein
MPEYQYECSCKVCGQKAEQILVPFSPLLEKGKKKKSVVMSLENLSCNIPEHIKAINDRLVSPDNKYISIEVFPINESSLERIPPYLIQEINFFKKLIKNYKRCEKALQKKK